MTKYIWHTQEDDKVRPWHASRDGKVFDSNKPPKGGNPGDAPNCRCWAEPIEEEQDEGKTYLLFDGQKLMWYENGQKVKEWQAMSGDKDCQSRKCIPLENIGPIPEGKWYVKQINHQKFDDLSWEDQIISYVGGLTKHINYPLGKWPGGNISWGNDRIWLEPDKKTNTQGRTNLSIHGGADLGSKGCIDLAEGMDNFISYFESHGEDIELIVKYPDWF